MESLVENATLRYALLLGAPLVGFVLIPMYSTYRRAVRGIGDHPGYRVLLSTNSIISFIIPEIPWITTGAAHSFRYKFKDFVNAGSGVYSVVNFWPKPRVDLFIADPETAKEVTSVRARFPKPAHEYLGLLFFGGNIVASEGEEWKKYRRVSAPAFSDRNNKLVWDESVRIVTDMMDNDWENKDEVVVDHTVNVTLPMALMIIGVAGFGRKISWKEDSVIPDGHKLTFTEALHIVSSEVVIKLLTPNWAYGLNKHFQKVKLGYDELEKYMLEMIRARKNSAENAERPDLFSSLLAANDEANLSPGEEALPDRELLGNIYIFLLAGHETTAHTLAFCFGLLALYQDEQEKLYKHIKTIIGDGRIPAYEEMPLFSYSLAVFYETLRRYPPVTAVPKMSAEDTTLSTTSNTGEKVVVPVPKGTSIHLSVIGLHHNPKYWENPEEFRPARFLGQWSRDAFMPFSAGARACLGRKFFETEGIAILTMLISRYKIDLTDEFKVQHVGQSAKQMEATLLKPREGLTLTPVKVPLVFRKRGL